MGSCEAERETKKLGSDGTCNNAGESFDAYLNMNRLEQQPRSSVRRRETRGSREAVESQNVSLARAKGGFWWTFPRIKMDQVAVTLKIDKRSSHQRVAESVTPFKVALLSSIMLESCILTFPTRQPLNSCQPPRPNIPGFSLFKVFSLEHLKGLKSSRFC